MPPTSTHAITLIASIAGRISAIEDAQIFAALGPRPAKKKLLRLDLHALDPLVGRTDWLGLKVRPRSAKRCRNTSEPSYSRRAFTTVVISGMAPIPWLMALGYALETVEVRVFQRLRVPATWSWQPDLPGSIAGTRAAAAAAPEARDVAVFISASAQIQPERVNAVLSPIN